MFRLLFIIFSGTSIIVFAQNPKGFDKMLEDEISGTIPSISVKEVVRLYFESENMILLDTRSEKEYKISHIKDSRWVGYDDFNLERVKDVPEETKIIVYCSIGYRSEKIGEKLVAQGYANVFNLYGGIFNWFNTGYPLVNAKGESTKRLHGYNEDWSQWINRDKGKVVLK